MRENVLWNNVAEELHLDAPRRLLAHSNVKEDDRPPVGPCARDGGAELRSIGRHVRSSVFFPPPCLLKMVVRAQEKKRRTRRKTKSQ